MDAPGLKQYEALSVEAAAGAPPRDDVAAPASQLVGAARRSSARPAGDHRARGPVARHGRSFAVRCGKPRPASREDGEITTLEGDSLQHKFLMGSDSFGRDIYSRVIYGTRVSLIVGILTALVALAFGIALGLTAGYLRWLDGVLMRVMDGVMAIPAILIAIALVALWGASLSTVIVAIAVPEIPRVTRLVRLSC
jgi:ABC-type dipeptide/oligopeptide/nickel transport system permease subunit